MTTEAARVLDRDQESPGSRLVLAATLLLVLAGSALFACHRLHQTPFMATPERLSICGREFSGPGFTYSLRQVQSAGAKQIGTIWTWQGRRQVWGHRVTLGLAPGCGTGVYLRVGSETFRGFALLGGP
jgi:hypothetical protein